jgi:hypothetical protein
MITPKEIKDQCLKWWKEVLTSIIDNKFTFPKEIIRIGKISSKDILLKLSEYKHSIEVLKSGSKECKTYGYTIRYVERQFERVGNQVVPDNIVIETLRDYLKLVSKEREFEIFVKNLSLIQYVLPHLSGWTRNNPLKLIEHNSWTDALKVCQYFIDNPKPNLYIRQLPIEIHTKYILENKAIIQSLLEYLIPEHINYNESRFELRFNLKYAEPLIRVRFLDNNISPLDGVSDISLPLSEFSVFECDCSNVFITENLMNFLTLPKLEKTIAIWSGGGFNVSYLKNIEWLKNNQFYYWGDLDAQGFQILNQFRTYFPNTTAVMMDMETLDSFKPVAGEPAANQNLKLLTDKELLLYQLLRDNNLRLEQEKITQAYAEAKIMELYNGTS